MRKIFITLAVAMAICFSTSAQTTKVVTDSVTFMPSKVQVYEGVNKNGNPKWWIELPTEDGKTRKVSLTENHVKSGRLLALIERKDENGRYSYSVKFAEPKNTGVRADLSSLR